MNTTALFLSIFTLLMLTACTQGPACGNGKIEAGETSATCCLDAGCIGTQTCTNNACKDPTCPPLQYLNPATHTCIDNPTCGACQYADPQTHACTNYSCCIDTSCPNSQVCIGHTCTNLACGKCEYPENHECKPMKCCTDADCNDDNSQTKDLCKYPSTKSASCTHETINECETSADCDDEDTLTQDTCSISKPRTCSHIAITDCEDNDDYCPEFCNYKNDNDCQKREKTCTADNLTCFTEALQDCVLAEVTATFDNSTSDVNMDIETYIQIKGENADDECKIYLKTRDVNTEFTHDYRSELEDDGYSDDEIDNKESAAQQNASAVEGYDLTCIYRDPDDFIDILNNWDDGDYHITDLKDECTGDYFN